MKILQLRSCQGVDDQGLHYLETLPLWMLNLYYTSVTQEGVRAFVTKMHARVSTATDMIQTLDKYVSYNTLKVSALVDQFLYQLSPYPKTKEKNPQSLKLALGLSLQSPKLHLMGFTLTNTVSGGSALFDLLHALDLVHEAMASELGYSREMKHLLSKLKIPFKADLKELRSIIVDALEKEVLPGLVALSHQHVPLIAFTNWDNEEVALEKVKKLLSS